MYIIFEEHQYAAEDVKVALHGISELQDINKNVSVSYVGYYYEPAIPDCVFILPKVLLNEKDELVIAGRVMKKNSIPGTKKSRHRCRLS